VLLHEIAGTVIGVMGDVAQGVGLPDEVANGVVVDLVALAVRPAPATGGAGDAAGQVVADI